ncbi:MAG: hypothetical protein DCC71_22935 [Proteobacteria bacterium]|nr:MAG: hypothetical protein DCC71_22935 [Pseudomonadota bacterium]
MRSIKALVFVLSSLLGLAPAARAAVLPFEGTLEVRIGGADSLFAITTTAAGSAFAQVNGSGAAGHLQSLEVGAGAFDSGVVEVPLTDPAAAPFVGMQLDVENQAGSFSGTGGAGFGGAMPLAGSFRLCTYPAPCMSAVNNLVVPLTVVGHASTHTQVGALNLTVVGAPWTTGTVAVGSLTAMGGVGPLSNTGAPSGTVTLVTPIFISTNLTNAVVPSFATMSLHFVPEPTTLTLLGAALVGVGALGRSRLR